MSDAGEWEARQRARRMYGKSPGLQRAYVRGYLAARDGLDEDACPYGDSSAPGWRSVFRRGWLRGYRSSA